MFDAVLEWLSGLPLAAVYAVACLSAAVENVFPPLPSDVVVAFAAFTASRGRGSIAALFLLVLAGSVAGAMLMYAVGARFGAAAVLQRIGGSDAQEARLRAWYARYGIVAIAASRLLPGVRAVVPPLAGALGIGAARSALAIALPSSLWYGGITYAAYTAGGDFAQLIARLGSGQRWIAIIGVVLVVGTVAVWVTGRARRPSPP